MLDPRHHFLADIATFLEIDAAELIHVGFMRKRIAVSEIEAAARDAERNAVGFIILRAHKRGAKFARRRGGAMRWNHHAKPERRQARIGVAQALFGPALAVPSRDHA